MTLELLQKSVRGLSFDSLNAVSGGHFTQHYEYEKLAETKKGQQSCFFNKNVAEKAFYESFKDEFFLNEILEKLNADYYGKGVFLIYNPDEENVIGKLYESETGEVTDCIDWVINLEFHGKEYSNQTTGLPFDMVTMFPFNENSNIY